MEARKTSTAVPTLAQALSVRALENESEPAFISPMQTKADALVLWVSAPSSRPEPAAETGPEAMRASTWRTPGPASSCRYCASWCKPVRNRPRPASAKARSRMCQSPRVMRNAPYSPPPSATNDASSSPINTSRSVS